jgi:hypothetical protein
MYPWVWRSLTNANKKYTHIFNWDTKVLFQGKSAMKNTGLKKAVKISNPWGRENAYD